MRPMAKTIEHSLRVSESHDDRTAAFGTSPVIQTDPRAIRSDEKLAGHLVSCVFLLSRRHFPAAETMRHESLGSLIVTERSTLRTDGKRTQQLRGRPPLPRDSFCARQRNVARPGLHNSERYVTGIKPRRLSNRFLYRLEDPIVLFTVPPCFTVSRKIEIPRFKSPSILQRMLQFPVIRILHCPYTNAMKHREYLNFFQGKLHK